MIRRRIHWCLRIMLILAMGWGLLPPAGAQAPKVPDGPPIQVQFQILHSFGAPGDGDGPGGMVMDSKGNLYGTTGNGGDSQYCNLLEGCGTVFELTPSGNGQWTETILHSFAGGSPDGRDPLGRLVIDGAGNLYGTTVFGGDGQYCPGFDGDCGTVYEVSPGANGVWTESILWDFCSQPSCADGIEPTVGPTLGPGGSLYGVAAYAAYQLTPSSGEWTISVLYTFCNIGPNCPTGSQPSGSLTLDAGGNCMAKLQRVEIAATISAAEWCTSCSRRTASGRRPFCTILGRTAMKMEVVPKEV
jgi:uncharacterized repeat protein (TIGR03803 family)